MKARSVLAVLCVVGLFAGSAFGQPGVQIPNAENPLGTDLPQILGDVQLGLIPGQDPSVIPSLTINMDPAGGWGDLVIDAKGIPLGSYTVWYGTKDGVGDDRDPQGIFTVAPEAFNHFLWYSFKSPVVEVPPVPHRGKIFSAGQPVVIPGVSSFLTGEQNIGDVIGEEFDSLPPSTILENIRFTFTQYGAAGTYNGRTTIIPEPSTIVMLLCGVMGLLVWRRRRS
jgi:hypothetical protein